MKRLLLTSFQTWLPHQVSNASDDLLAMVVGRYLPGIEWVLLRQLPVETREASETVLAAIETYHPDGIICCGMAESRSQLTVESNGRKGQQRLYTSVNLAQLIAPLSLTHISHDAGNFVCEGVYFEVLRYLQEKELKMPCLFVHVPILTAQNQVQVFSDFQQILGLVHLSP
ncbi:peptidase C15 [Spirulina sp. CS-785/01]|uniref:peptidase C15 n=1 Tax=Spirulina sp. CS-785/01 TaxID=3021716 RepID=UPI00232D4B5C|nr:peptidase C15 [Spirulina sp. CS-785/01]MDB9315078.1 peptidase C15 [Spirulina sp. CS-785/01]